MITNSMFRSFFENFMNILVQRGGCLPNRRLARVAGCTVALCGATAMFGATALFAQVPDRPAGVQPSPAATAVVPTPDYKLGPGDVLQVFVWRNPELSISVPVRPDGKISTPLVDDMVAVGKTPSQLARDLETTLSEYVLSPKVNVIVTGSSSAANQVKVIGQVRAPQPLAYRAGMTVLDVVMASGGLTEFAAGNKARLLRKAPDGKEQVIKVRVADLLKGKLKGNIPVNPGDVLVVPESLF